MTFEEKALAAGGHLGDDVALVVERTLTAPHLPVEERRSLLETLILEDAALD